MTAAARSRRRAEAPRTKRAPRRNAWRRRLGALAIGLFAVIAAAAGAIYEGPTLRGPSALLFDQYQRLAPRSWSPDTPVRVVAIDDESLRRYGQWPWPRTYFIELLDRLDALGVATVVIDMLLADPDRTSPEVVAEATRRFDQGAPPAPLLSSVTNHDALLSRRMAQSPVVLGALPIAEPAQGSTPDPFVPKAGFSFIGSDPRASLRAFVGVTAPLPAFVSSASGYGLTGFDETGGVVRRAQMISRVGDEIAPSIAFEALRVAQGARGYLLRSSAASGQGSGGAAPVAVEARVGDVTAPLTGDGAIWLRYAGPHPDRVVPAWRLFEGRPGDAALADSLAGRIVLIGATASGLRYVADTPLDSGVDGVVIQAEALEQLIDGDHLLRPDWALGLELVAVALSALLCALLIGPLGPVGGAALGAGVVAALIGGSWAAFAGYGLLLSPVWPAFAATACYLVLTAQNYLLSTRQTRQVRQQFERFVAPEVIRTIAEDPAHGLRARGELRPITLLFTDVRGFTTLSETMPPEQLISYLNQILEELSDCVLSRGGTIDKYMGDCVMAFWNAPVETPGHEARAIEALFAIRAAQDRLNRTFAAAGLPAIRLGSGLNTGVCNVGLMGSARRLEYSCIGDAVNIASRLQDLTKSFGVWNCVGRSVIEAAPEWTGVELDVATIRGRQQAEPVWTVLGPASRSDDPEIVSLRAAVAEARALRDAARAGGVEARADLDAALSAMSALHVEGVDTKTLAEHYRKL